MILVPVSTDAGTALVVPCSYCDIVATAYCCITVPCSYHDVVGPMYFYTIVPCDIVAPAHCYMIVPCSCYDVVGPSYCYTIVPCSIMTLWVQYPAIHHILEMEISLVAVDISHFRSLQCCHHLKT